MYLFPFISWKDINYSFENKTELNEAVKMYFSKLNTCINQIINSTI